MKRSILIVISLIFVLAVPVVSSAGVHVSIGIPSPFVFAGPPDLVVVPSGDADVYMVPGTPGLYFYDDWWYRLDRGHWYRSRRYDGRWDYVERHRVPGFIVDVPPDYWRHLPRDYNRIHYGDFHNHWRQWHRDRHWRRYDWYNRGHRERMHEHYGRELDHRRPRELHDRGRYDRGRHGDRMDRGRRDMRMDERGRHGDDTHRDDRGDRGHRR
jgi:hypothetical protein